MPEPSNPISSYLDTGERFYTSTEIRDFYNLLKENGTFQSHADAFMASIALGISHEKFEPLVHRVDLMILAVYRSADPNGIFPLLVKVLHPELDKTALARRMEEYAIYGAKLLMEQHEKLGKIDFDLFHALAKA